MSVASTLYAMEVQQFAMVSHKQVASWWKKCLASGTVAFILLKIGFFKTVSEFIPKN